MHIGARIGPIADPSEVLVSGTVQGPVSGRPTFEQAGEHGLQGVPERWHLYRAVAV